jgi:preprotein translocase subunit SecG
MHILLYFLLTLHVIVCLLMVLVVLMQRPRSEGLGAAFGSGMTENIFGAQTTHVLAKFTTWLGISFFVLTLGLAMVYAHLNPSQNQIQKELLSMPVPKAAAATPAPAAVPAATPQAAQPTPAAAAPAPSVAPSAAPAATAAPVAAPASK